MGKCDCDINVKKTDDGFQIQVNGKECATVKFSNDCQAKVMCCVDDDSKRAEDLKDGGGKCC
ncbi:MAG: hypothetical protein ABIJ45_08005 [Candidatus Zixiibacteriota bacterium]